MTAMGMVSPVGANVTQTLTSVRANILRKKERPDIYLCLPEDPDIDPPEPLVASAISHLDCRFRNERSPTEWLALMAANAFADLWDRAKLTGDEAIGLFLALPTSRPDWGRGHHDRFANCSIWRSESRIRFQRRPETGRGSSKRRDAWQFPDHP
jgi:hypothetical protein